MRYHIGHNVPGYLPESDVYATDGINGGPCVSGVANCPCCGDPTMVADWRVPELCPECVEYGCDTSEPCNVPTEDDPWVYADDPRER